MSKPLTRKEQYYANIAGEGVEIPAKPITREEAYLEKIAQGGGVVANPEGTPAGTLETVKIGDVVYEVPQGGGSGTTNYELLNNKPSINGHELSGDKSADDLGLFDGDYAHLTNKPSIPAAQVNSDWNATSGVAEILNKPSIPSALSQLTDDASHRTVSDTEKSAWNAKSNFSGSYDDLTDKPTIPDAQIQSDWNQTDNTKPDYIKNKPAATSQVQTDWEQSDNTKVDYIKNKPTLGTAAAKNVPASGDAGLTEVVMGDDSRLTDSRPASDVSSWAKASTKPTYSASEVGAIDSTALGAAGGVAQLGNDGKVPSAQLPTLFDGDYDSLVHRPSIGGVTLTGDKSASALGLQAEMQLASMPAASADYAGKLVQYIGATDSTYTHGYFYECVLNQGTYIWQQTNVQASSGGGGTSDYTDLTNKPQINGVTLTGNKSTSDLGIDAAGVGLGNVPNVTTDDQTPTFTTAQSRNNLVSGEKLSIMLGKISKFFNDLKTVAFSGSYKDLSNKPQFDTMPTASSDYLGDIVQYMGASITGSYQHGYFYECTTDGSTYSWVQTNVQPSSGSGGGHTIVNGAGTSMTQRNALQFTGGLTVSDDSTNERTTISDDYELIAWTDWQTIVANHEEDLHPNAVITGVPDADGDISVELMTKLWENPSPSSDFAGQTLNVDLSGYDFFAVETPDGMAWGTKNNRAIAELVGSISSVNYIFRRTFTVTGQTLVVSNVYRVKVSDGTDSSASNNYCIPIRIYGIKLTASVKVSAIAENVSTSADKCMLSDGVTSVESVLTYSETEHVVGKWIDGKTVYEKTVDCGNLPNSTYKDIAHNISNFGKLIELKGATSSGSPVPYVANVLANCISAFVTSTNIRLVTTSDLSPYTAYVTIRYTKSS